MENRKKVIGLVLAIIVLIYVIYAIFLLIVKPTDTYVIRQSTLSKEDSVTGYIIRNEVVVKGDNVKNGIYAVIAEGEKVAKSSPIFRYYSDGELETNTKITELNHKIQELLEQEKIPSSADTKAIENQIESKIENVRNITKYQEIAEYKNDIDTLFNKKINVIEELTDNSEIKKIVKEKSSYESKLKTGTEYQIAPISGIVSYRVDGLEDKFNIENLNQIKEDNLKEIDSKTGEIIATSKECGKVIDNFRFYIAAVLDSDEAMNAKIGDTVQIRTSSKEEIQAKIAYINEESGKRTIIFQTNKITEDLINHRKIAIDVIWWNKTGLKVPNQALIRENDLYYVIRSRAGIQTKVLVKVECQTDRFSIISTYSAKDLQELGFKQEDIKNYKKINNYDEIILQTK